MCLLILFTVSFLSIFFGISTKIYWNKRKGTKRQKFQLVSQRKVFTLRPPHVSQRCTYCSISKYNFRFRGRSKNCFRVAIRRLQKSWQYAYRDRRRKRREWSKFWIQRIQAGVRQYSWRYSQFMGSYKHSGIKLDRKVSFLDIFLRYVHIR